MANRIPMVALRNLPGAANVPVNQSSFNLDKELTVMKGFYQSLNEVWYKIGIGGADREMRAKAFLQYNQDLQKNMLDEETSLYDRLVTSVNNLNTELEAVQRQLDIKVNLDADFDQKSILHQKRHLKEALAKLLTMKFERLEELENLQKREMELCSALNLTPVNNGLARTGEDVDDVNVPSKVQLQEIQDHIKDLQDEKNIRLNKVEAMRLEIVDVLGDLQMAPSSVFEEAVVSTKGNMRELLFIETINNIKTWLLELLEMQTRNKTTFKNLLRRLITLWDALGIEQPERERFLSSKTHYGQPTMATLEQEIDRYKEMKNRNIIKFIDSIREQLALYWDKCYVAQKERDNFVAYKDAILNEEVVELHEMEVNKWKQRYEDNKHIFTKIQRRNEVWEQKRIFYNKSQDPARFSNRGANLLQEERVRRRVEHELQKLDLEIEKLVKEWEVRQENGQIFLITGTTYQDYVQNQRTRFQKELQNKLRDNKKPLKR